MKYFTLLLFSLPFLGWSQSIEIYATGSSTDFSGDTHYVYAPPPNDVIVDLKIINQSDSAQNWSFQRIQPATPFWENNWLHMVIFIDPFGGVIFPIDQDPIWTTGVGIDVPQHDSVRLTLNYEFVANGCSFYQYYILSDNVRVDSFSINLCNALGVDEINLNSATIYPNPTSDYLTIDFKNEVPSELLLFDILGNQTAVFDPEKSTVISTNDISEGMYYLYWEINGARYRKKFDVVK